MDMGDNSVWQPPQSIEDMYSRSHSMGGMNRPTSGARSEKALEIGQAPFQLYSLATPNGQKCGILLEELKIPYDAHVVNIARLEQFTSGFVKINPNSKIPAAVDLMPRDGGPPLRLFESASIMVYLAEKYDRFIPKTPRERAECLSWVMWQIAGQGPMTGNFGHFFVYAPDDQGPAREYGVSRYGMEVQRLCSTLDQHLRDNDGDYICGHNYTIADMIIFPWFDLIRKKGYTHHSGVAARNFLNVAQYKHANAWADHLCSRVEVQRGMLVCRGVGKPWLSNEPRFASRFGHLRREDEAVEVAVSGSKL